MTNSERRVQRVRKVLEPPGNAKDDIWIIAQLAKRLGFDWGEVTPRAAWDELRSLSPMHAGMTYERLEALEGIQWPCYDEEHAGTLFLHAPAVGGGPRQAGSEGAVQRDAVRAAGGRAHRGVPVPPHDRSPAGLVQHRGADGRRTRRRFDAAKRSTCLRRTPIGSGWRRMRSFASRRGGVARGPGAGRPGPAPRTVFMTLHFPDQVDTNSLTIDATDPKSGTAEFKAARSGSRRSPNRWGRGAAVDLVMPDALAATTNAPPWTPCSAGDLRWPGGERIESEGHVARGGHEAREQRHLLLPVLHALQWSAGGSAPAASATPASASRCRPPRRTGSPPSTRCSRSNHGRRRCSTCVTTSRQGSGRGGADRRGRPRDRFGQVLRGPCLGMCERAPAALLQTGDSNDVAFGPVRSSVSIRSSTAGPGRR